MKSMILAALAVLSLGIGAANAQSYSHGDPRVGSQSASLNSGGS